VFDQINATIFSMTDLVRIQNLMKGSMLLYIITQTHTHTHLKSRISYEPVKDTISIALK